MVKPLIAAMIFEFLSCQSDAKKSGRILFVIGAYLEQSSSEHGFLAALNDAQIGKALKLMHALPAQDWTLESC